jgi:CDP-diacylglycerol---glycerol-3-phosphate 3-phosphatidyltransferase
VMLSSGSNGRCPASQPRALFLAATSLTFLKPRLKRSLRPLAERLFRTGITANQVTLISLIGSVGVGVVLSICGNRSILFGLLPAWLLARMGFATIDGTLAIDFGQKSQLGGFLNEAGDILSDIALFPPLASVRRAVPTRLGCTRHRTHCANRNRRNRELYGGWLAAPRWPFGKADRSLALGAVGGWIASIGSLPRGAAVLLLIFATLLLVTIINRMRFAVAVAKKPLAGSRRPMT